MSRSAERENHDEPEPATKAVADAAFHYNMPAWQFTPEVIP